MTEDRTSACTIDFTLGELYYLYRLLRSQGYLENKNSAAVHRKVEERLFLLLSLEEIMSLDAKGADV